MKKFKVFVLALLLAPLSAPAAAPDSRGEALSEAGAKPPGSTALPRAHMPPSPKALRSRGPAADYVWLIGGGYDPNSSQAQIEQNVLWVSRLLKTIPGARTQRIYFDDGDNPANDVREQMPLRTASLEPLRRLFAHGHVAGYRYRNHAIPRVDGGTEHTALVANLEREIAGLRPGDRLLIVFNGHGSRNRRDSKGNRLWLWNNTSLDVREFDTLLARVPPVVPVRFVFTQCYAGAFARL